MPKLLITDGPDAGQSHPLTGQRVTVGRGDGTGIQLTDLTVSREHFRLEVDQGAWRVVDLGSRNRTLVNAQPVADHSLCDGDRITVGSTSFLFIADEEPPRVGGLDVLPEGFDNVTLELRGFSEPADQTRHLAALYRFAEDLSVAERLDDVYERIARLSRDACQADRAFLFVLDRAGDLATAAIASDVRGDRVAVSRTVLDKVLCEATSVISADAYGDVRFSGQRSIVENTIRSVMCAPVVSRGRTIGLLYVDIRREGFRFGDDDLRFLTALAQQAGIAIDNLRLRAALQAENENLRGQAAGRHDLVGRSRAMVQLYAFIDKVARTDSTVMINGESGTGKELVANAIHLASPRAGRPFVAVNCAALTESLLESELFGHEKGAFTGATGMKQGRFELADGGTLFLDEVGELTPTCQTKFLRVLEESCFQRVGGTRTLHTDVRVVAATNRDLPAMVRDGAFRADLFYRLQVIQIELPPLRQRREDIPLLVRHFVERYVARMGRRIEGVEPAAMERLGAYEWPGNVRELKNAIERAMVLGEGPILRADDLPPDLHARRVPVPAGELDARPLKDLERDAIIAALNETNGNKLRAASLLGIDRSTLYKKLKDYDIAP